MIKKNKRGVSLMIAYVLLIVIAVGLSLIVFTYLKLYVPKPGLTPTCPHDTTLMVSSYSCSITQSKDTGTVIMNLTNNGLFTIDGVYVRFAPTGVNVRPAVAGDSLNLFVNPLAPGKTKNIQAGLTSNNIGSGASYNLEIEPAVINDKGIPGACEDSIIVQPVNCKLS